MKILWNNSAGGSFNSAPNWAFAGVPGPAGIAAMVATAIERATAATAISNLFLFITEFLVKRLPAQPWTRNNTMRGNSFRIRSWISRCPFDGSIENERNQAGQLRLRLSGSCHGVMVR